MENKVILVTGSARGIGKATIIEFASKGYNVVINYTNSENEAFKLKSYVENEYNIEALTIKADVSNETEVKNMVKTIIDKFKRIDVLVNNAGIIYNRNFKDVTVDEFRRTLDVNIMGAFIVSREVAQYMSMGCSIINVSSINGSKTIGPQSIDYNISKVGMQSLTRDLAYILRPNIRVNAVSIGWAETDMSKDLPKEYIDEEKEKICLKRFANPNEIAKTIYFLASDEASYITSEVITIDGGYMI